MKIRHHSASVLILPETPHPEHVLLGVYTDDYAVACFRGHFQFLGGNALNDDSPLITLERELNGEIGETPEDHEQITEIIGSTQKVQQKTFQGKLVPKQKRLPFLEDVLSKREKHKDYLVTVQGDKIRRDTPLVYLCSIFIARINQSLFYNIAEEIKEGASIINEGRTGVFSLSELERGTVRGAWAYDAILHDVTRADIPQYDWLRAEPQGLPRDSYQAYKTQGFEYERDPETPQK